MSNAPNIPNPFKRPPDGPQSKQLTSSRSADLTEDLPTANFRDSKANVSYPYSSASLEPLLSISESRFRLDSTLIEETKERIRQQVHQLHELAKTVDDLDEFIGTAFGSICDILGASAIGLWLWSNEQGWQIVFDKDLPNELVSADTDHEPLFKDQARKKDGPRKRSHKYFDHVNLLHGVRTEGQPVLIPPSSVELVSNRPANPTEHQILFARVPTTDPTHELWLEILQPPSGTLTNQRGYLRFSCQMAELIGDFLNRSLNARQKSDQRFFGQVSQWLEHCSLHREASPKSTIDLLREVSGARHAILLTRIAANKPWRVLSIAGLSKVDRRTDAVSVLERAAARIERQQPKSVFHWILQPKQCDAPSLNAKSSYETSLDANEVEPSETDFEDLKSLLKASSIAYWKPQSYPAHMDWRKTVDLCSLLTVRENALTSPEASGHENISLLMAWGKSSGIGSQLGHGQSKSFPQNCFAMCSTIVRTAAILSVPSMGRFGKGFDSKRVPFNRPKLIRMASWLVLTAIVLAVLAFPIPLQIEANAQLMPSSSRELFSPNEGLIEHVSVIHGQRVSAGDTCLTISSPSLQSQLEQAYAGLVKSQQRFSDLEGKLLRDRALTAVEKDTLESERDALEQVIALEKSGIANLEKQTRALRVVAPINGIVETWRVDSTLRDRPVQTGQWLLTIREEEAAWQFEADFPERRIQDLMIDDGRPFFAFARLIAAPQTAIPLRFDKTQALRTIPRKANQEQNANDLADYSTASMRVHFEIDSEIPAELMVTGAKARIAVHMGHAPIVWVLGQDFFEDLAVRLRMWLP